MIDIDNLSIELDYSKSIVHEIEGVRYIPILNIPNSISISYVFLEQGKFVPYHSHEKTRHTYHFAKGEAELLVDGVRGRKVAPWILKDLPPGPAHKITNVGKEMLEFLTVEVPPDDGDFKEEKEPETQ